VWRVGADECWLCYAPFDQESAGNTSAVSGTAPSKLQISERGFSLSSAMLVMTLICVVLGLFSVAPGLGLVGLLLFAPSLSRTVAEVQRRKKRGQPTTIGEKAAVFAASLGVIVLGGTAAAIAFFASCMGGILAGQAIGGGPQGPPDDLMFIGALAGLGIGLVLGLWVFRRVTKKFAAKE
jgi:hypothetical protein